MLLNQAGAIFYRASDASKSTTAIVISKVSINLIGLPLFLVLRRASAGSGIRKGNRIGKIACLPYLRKAPGLDKMTMRCPGLAIFAANGYLNEATRRVFPHRPG